MESTRLLVMKGRRYKLWWPGKGVGGIGVIVEELYE